MPALSPAELRERLLALEAEIGAGVEVPEGPMDGEQLRAILMALVAAADIGVFVPPLPFTGAQLEAVLGALGSEDPVPPGLPPPPPPPPLPAGSRGLISGSEPPTPTDGLNGQMYVRTWLGNLEIYGPKTAGDWGEPVFFWDGGIPSPPPRLLLLEQVRGDEKWPIGAHPEPLEISSITASTVGSHDRLVRFSFWHGPDPNESGIEVVEGGILVGTDVITLDQLDAPVIPAGHWLWFTTSEATGAISAASFGVWFR